MLPLRPTTASTLRDRPRSVSSTAGSTRSNVVPNSPSRLQQPSQNAFNHPSPRIGGGAASRPQTSNGSVQLPRKRKLRSQYPIIPSERHVEYILVASFDIDRGPIMEHQYPGAISPDEHMLAELMLPDQTHVRTQDWTMFFLHKDAGMDEELLAERQNRQAKRKERRQMKEETLRTRSASDQDISSEDSDDTEESGTDESEGPPLMYVLNLVNTKQDSTAKRGAVVKSMAICTRHSFLHIYKPILVLALEDYFKSPFPETLQLLYNSLNAMDLSLMPRLSLLERHILQASDTKYMFIEKFELMVQQRSVEDSQIMNVPEDPESPTRTAQKYTIPRDTHEFESKIVYNGIPLPVKVPVARSPELVGGLLSCKTCAGIWNSTCHPSTAIRYSSSSYHLWRIYSSGDCPPQRNVDPENVLFSLGHNRPSADVVEAVLAACALASGGVLRGFTRHAFPYTDLSKIDELLKVPGFVAGVTNPTFAYHPEWWDVLLRYPDWPHQDIFQPGAGAAHRGNGVFP